MADDELSAEDAEACAEALESLDRIDEPEIIDEGIGSIAQGSGKSAESDNTETTKETDEPEPQEDPAKDDAAEQPAEGPTSPSAEKTTLLASGPDDAMLTRQLTDIEAASVAPVDATVAIGDMPLPTVPTAHEADRRRLKESPRAPKLIAAAVVIAIAAIGIGGYAAWNAYQQHREEALQQQAYSMMSVQIGIDIEGLNTGEGSKIPVNVEGQDANGIAVSFTAFVDEKGWGIKLLPGNYTLSIAASPIASDGTLYEVPDNKASVAISHDEQDLTGNASFSFKALSAQKVTDSELSSASKYAAEGGCVSEAAANNLKQLATSRVEDAKEAAQAREEEERHEANERHKATPLYTLDIPAAWYGKVSTWQNDNTLGIYLDDGSNTQICQLDVERTGSTFTCKDTILGSVDLKNGYTVFIHGTAYPYVVPQTLQSKAEKPASTYSEDLAESLVELTTGNHYTFSQIKNGLVGPKATKDDAVKLERDHLAQALLPSIKANE